MAEVKQYVYKIIKCSYFSMYQFINCLQKIQLVCCFFHMRDWVACSSSSFSPQFSAAAAAAAAADSNSGTVFSRTVGASELDAGFSTLVGGVSVVFLVLLLLLLLLLLLPFSGRLTFFFNSCKIAVVGVPVLLRRRSCCLEDHAFLLASSSSSSSFTHSLAKRSNS